MSYRKSLTTTYFVLPFTQKDRPIHYARMSCVLYVMLRTQSLALIITGGVIRVLPRSPAVYAGSVQTSRVTACGT